MFNNWHHICVDHHYCNDQDLDHYDYYSDHGHDHSDQSLDHHNNDDDQHKYDVSYVKFLLSSQFIVMNLLPLLFFSIIISVLIIVITDMIIVSKVLIITIRMMNTNMMLAMWKSFDQVSLLLLTYCHYHLSQTSSEIMDMTIVIKVLIITIMMMINTNVMFAMWK